MPSLAYAFSSRFSFFLLSCQSINNRDRRRDRVRPAAAAVAAEAVLTPELSKSNTKEIDLIEGNKQPRKQAKEEEEEVDQSKLEHSSLHLVMCTDCDGLWRENLLAFALLVFDFCWSTPEKLSLSNFDLNNG